MYRQFSRIYYYITINHHHTACSLALLQAKQRLQDRKLPQCGCTTKAHLTLHTQAYRCEDSIYFQTRPGKLMSPVDCPKIETTTPVLKEPWPPVIVHFQLNVLTRASYGHGFIADGGGTSSLCSFACRMGHARNCNST